MDYEIFELGNVPLLGGATLRSAKLACSSLPSMRRMDRPTGC